MRKILMAGLVALASATPGFSAAMAGYGVEVLVDGVATPEYRHGSVRYIEALKGHEYAIRLRNDTASRVAVALSVDGMNTIDARHTTAREAMKWVLDPHQTIVISGWQMSSAMARQFYFTTEGKSYASWLGDTRNIGILSAAFFRERQPRIVHFYGQEAKTEREKSPASGAAPVPLERESSKGAELDEGYAATGIGRETEHRVTRVSMELEDSPAACISLRYEYRSELIRLGVLPPVYFFPSPLERREHAHGFEDGGFAPDPYRRH